MNISVVGLGKLGAALSAVLADAGHDVVGVDLLEGPVNDLAAGVAPVTEPGLQELIDANRDRLTATLSFDDAVAASRVTFIVVPTPSDETGWFGTEHVVDAARKVGRALSLVNPAPLTHLVVVCSTVMPGSTLGSIRAALQRASGRIVGPQLGLCYSPEFIALGTVIHDMRHPDMVLIGESDPAAGDLLERILRSVTLRADTPYHRMSIPSAEVAKLSVNAYVTMKISFANVLAEICEGVRGADVRTVAQAVGADSRIGAKYLRPATPYGGPCFPRDAVAFAQLARSARASPELADATRTVNERQLRRIRDRVEGLTLNDEPIGVLGLAYKPGTHVTEESPGLHLALALQASKHPVIVYDPMVSNHVDLDQVTWAGTAAEVLKTAQVTVLMTPWAEFKKLKTRGRCILDVWNVLDDAPNVVRLGRSE